MNSLDFEKHFVGRWRLTRTIDAGFEADGVCHVRAYSSGQYRFDEECALKGSDGQTWNGQQHYMFEFTGSSIKVYFKGLRQGLFVEMQENNGIYSGEHLCGADTYRMAMTLGEACFSTHVTITGPNKAFDILSTYEKISGGF